MDPYYIHVYSFMNDNWTRVALDLISNHARCNGHHEAKLHGYQLKYHILYVHHYAGG